MTSYRRPNPHDFCHQPGPQLEHEQTLNRVRFLETQLKTVDTEYEDVRALAQAAYDLALAGGGGTPVATIFNTAGVTTLRGVDVVGFEDAANDIDARLTALGY